MSFDTTPKPAFLLAMQNRDWTIHGALSELVDNSLGSGRGNADNIKITYDQKSRVIEILDDGLGMDEIGRLFQLGNTIGKSIGDIGLYGSGGTMALLWLGKTVSIWTMRAGRVMHDRVDWKKQIREGEFPSVSSEWKKASLGNTPTSLLEIGRGTLIRIAIRDERGAMQVSNVVRDLSTTYAPALRGGKEITFHIIGKNTTERVLSDPYPNLANEKLFDGVVELDGKHLPFKGRIGIVEDLPYAQSLVRIGFGHRVIKSTRDCYDSPTSDEKFLGVGVCGYVDLGEGWQDYLSTTKEAINHAGAWSALMAFIYEEIRPLLVAMDEEKLSVVFEDLEFSLSEMLNGKSEMEATLGIPHDDGDYPTPASGGTYGIRKSDREDDPDGTDGKKSASTEIVIERLTDAQMDGELCRVEPNRDDLIVLVNQDHDVIQQCLKEKPLNKMALTLLITTEMAGLAVDDQAFMNKLFGRRRGLLDQINRKSGRRSFICRILMDRSRA
ncbi:MAG: ATP-binding protein, partial [Blastocatellia bacterium]|nr:ATP-binding protein [Blastocatellia bacterium]